MSSNTADTRTPSPSIMGMAGPLVISFWMRAVITFVDTIYASLLGDAEIAAIGLTVPFEFLMIALWVGLSTGLTSCLSRAMGSRQGARIEQYLRASRWLVAIMAPLFTLVGAGIWFAAPHVGLAPEVADSFRVYGTVLIAGSAFTSFWSIIPDSLVKAHQDTRSTMWAGILSNITNVTLNTLFLFVFEWGIFGIAFSTVLSRITGLMYAVLRARVHERERVSSRATPLLDRDPGPFRAILRLAVPSSITFMLMALETALINGLLAHGEHPTESIAAYSIYYRVVLFCLQPVIAFSVAMLPFAARRIGADDYAGVRAGLRQTGLAALGYSLVLLGPTLWFLAQPLADALSESQLTQEYTAFALRVVPLACLTGSLFLLCRPVFEAMNRGRPGLIMAGLRYLVLTLPLAWLGMTISERFGHPAVLGLIYGLLVAAAASSVVFFLWLQAALPRSARGARPDGVG